jgi:hypothetical protein
MVVITGLVPMIHVLLFCVQGKTWMAGPFSAKTRFALLPAHDVEGGEQQAIQAGTAPPPHAFFFTSLMLEKVMPSARSRV